MKKYWKWILLLLILVTGVVTGVHLINPSEKFVRAMYIPGGKDEHLMVDQENGTIFTVDMSENIQGKDGKKISQKELKRGNIVAIYGDGIMLESYPGQYPGVSKIKVLKEGKPTDADQYQNILDQFWPEKDPAEIPGLNVGYRTSYGQISAVTAQGGFNWSYTDKEGVMHNQNTDTGAVTCWTDLPDMNIEENTDMELYFDVEPENVTATAFSSELSGRTDPGPGAEADVEKQNGKYILKDAQTDMIYLIHGEWGNGWAEFGFRVVKIL